MNVAPEPSTEPVLTLAELRESRGLSMNQLAKAAGYKGHASIRALEQGSYPRLNRALPLASVLRVTPEQLAASIEQSYRRRLAAEPATEESEAPEG